MKELINTIEQTMSSFEIAKLTGKQHSHIMRDIRTLNKAYENLHQSKIGLKHRISDLGEGRQRNDPYFELTKMQTFDLLTGYNTELRIKVNRRWAELEALTQIKMPKSLNVYGMEALPYVEWLLLHNYTVLLLNKNMDVIGREIITTLLGIVVKREKILYNRAVKYQR